MNTFLFFFVSLVIICGDGKEFDNGRRIFDASLYKRFSKRIVGNFLASPFSTETVLSLIYAGSLGETAEEIRNVLAPAEAKPHFLSNTQQYSIHTANKIYVQDGYPIKANFLERAVELYRSECENVNLKNKDAAARVINDWVERKTNYNIGKLLDRSDLSNDARVVLVNTLYFQANWSKPFPARYTRKMGFRLSNLEVVDADMMFLHNKVFEYFESGDLNARFLRLPFKGGEAFTVIVLPNDADGLQRLEVSLRRVLTVRKFSQEHINLMLPKFKIETTVDLKPILKKMGVVKIFDENEADLSGIAGEKGDLVVDRIVQKTFIDVSEGGVEAAAATYASGVVLLSGPSGTPKNFSVDRPFIFYIEVKGVVVFVGRIRDPRPQGTAEDTSRIIFRY